MPSRWISCFAAAALALLIASAGLPAPPPPEGAGTVRGIVTSDTILSGMIASLLPPGRYVVDAVLSPGQCPGHYDVKFSDIEKIKRADLVVSFKGMPFMKIIGAEGGKLLLVDTEDRNWMVPDSYLHGLGLLAGELSKRFPEDRETILRCKEETTRTVRNASRSLVRNIRRAGLSGKPVIASSMQKEPLEWMGFLVVGEYGRPEAMSAGEIVRIVKTGKERHAIAVVDNLQSGPDAGRGIAETLGVPHVVLTNFPSEEGYLATLGENTAVIMAALRK
jgi:zinc transport system substrate-binding protein